MSKLNILGIVKNIKNKANVYVPIVEAVFNSIKAINEKADGKIEIVVCNRKLIEDAKMRNKIFFKMLGMA